MMQKDVSRVKRCANKRTENKRTSLCGNRPIFRPGGWPMARKRSDTEGTTVKRQKVGKKIG